MIPGHLKVVIFFHVSFFVMWTLIGYLFVSDLTMRVNIFSDSVKDDMQKFENMAVDLKKQVSELSAREDILVDVIKAIAKQSVTHK